MKTLQIAVITLFSFIAASCSYPAAGQRPMGTYPQQSYPQQGPQQGSPRYGQVGYGQQQQGGGQRRLDSITVTKNRTGYCEAQVKRGNEAQRPRVAQYASSVYEKTGRVPSEGQLTQKFGFPCRARWIDTPDQKVASVRVRPDEVPTNIRAKFQ